jgi:3'(2'), 5'-bisphosphate nucleotidase
MFANVELNSSQINELLQVVRNAGKAVMEIYDKEITVETKSDTSPLTKADLVSNTLICKFLKSNYNFPIISEENSESHNFKNDENSYWLVDPLDGTKEFIAKNGEFTINIALIQNCEPTFGIVYAPSTDEFFYAQKFMGSFLIKDNVILPLKKDRRYKICKNQIYFKWKKQVTFIVSRSHKSNLESFKDILCPKCNYEIAFKEIGSSLKFCRMAQGIGDIYYRNLPTKEWDTAAGQIIAQEANLNVYDKETFKTLKYGKSNLLNKSFIVF